MLLGAGHQRKWDMRQVWGLATYASGMCAKFISLSDSESPVTAPKGWVTITQYARKLRRTVRGIQYRIDGTGIATRIFKTPRPVAHYQAADLDRILRKAP